MCAGVYMVEELSLQGLLSIYSVYHCQIYHGAKWR